MPKMIALQKFPDGTLGVVLDDTICWDGSVQLLTATEIFKLKLDARNEGKKDERERLNDVERTREAHEELVAELRTAREMIEKLRNGYFESETLLRKYFDEIKIEV